MPTLQSILPFFLNAPGFDAEAFLASHQAGAVNSFRINSKKINTSPFENASPVPWCDTGFYLKERPAYAQHPFWHAGAFYVQEASSMFLDYVMRRVLDLEKDLCVLDACAAPGGKSTLMASLLNHNSVLVSNEVIRSRVNVLAENLTRWGNANSIITSNDTQQFAALNQVFDAVVVDAPCSGSGLFRKDAEAMNEWSENNVQLCGERQQRIVSNLLPSLKNEGVLIYSTCSYSVEENEKMVDWLCQEHHLEAVEIDVPADWNIVNSQPGCYRFYPYKLEGEGFFLAILRKKRKDETPKGVNAKSIKLIKPETVFTNFVDGAYDYFMHHEALFAATPKLLELTEVLKKAKINLVRCGVEIGLMKGNKFVPAHALALNEILNPNTESIGLGLADALRYLKKETINLEAAPGYKIIQYQEVNLGWVNVLPQRSNNLYPTNWRLLN